MDPKILLVFLVAYFIGNLSPSYFVGKEYKNIDIREHGSKNAGTTNVLRVMGAKFALFVFIVDLLKGTVVSYFTKKYFGINIAMAASIFVVLGHIYPVLLKFRGGKGVATSLGTALGVFPKLTLIAWAITIVVIALSRYVSLGSLTLVSLITVFIAVNTKDYHIAIPSAIITGIVFYSHRGNIDRLIHGNERKLGEKAK